MTPSSCHRALSLSLTASGDKNVSQEFQVSGVGTGIALTRNDLRQRCQSIDEAWRQDVERRSDDVGVDADHSAGSWPRVSQGMDDGLGDSIR